MLASGNPEAISILIAESENQKQPQIFRRFAPQDDSAGKTLAVSGTLQILKPDGNRTLA